MPTIADSLDPMTPKDLRKFTKKMVDEILQAQKDGWIGHVNRQGHASLLAPDGKETVIVSPNPNSVNHLQMGINRYHRRAGKPVEEVKEKVAQKWPCARPGCPKVFVSEEKLNGHIAVDHEGMTLCPECGQPFKRPASLGAHRSRKHGYESPGKARRKELESKRAGIEKTIEDLTDLQKELTEPEREERLKQADEIAKKWLEESGLSEPNDLALEVINDAFAGAKFDPSLAIAVTSGEPIMDTMDIKEPDGPSLKGLVTSVTKFDPPILFEKSEEIATPEYSPNDPLLHFYQSPSPTLAADEIRRRTNRQIFTDTEGRLPSKPVDDHRDSWVLDASDISDRRIGTLQQILKAAGLNMEIRVWKEGN